MNKGWFPKYWRFACRYFFHDPLRSFSTRQALKMVVVHPLRTASNRSFHTFVPCLFVLKALAQQNEEKEKAGVQDVIREADALYDKADYAALYDLLSQKTDSEEPEILWRLARALFEKSRATSDNKKKLELLEQAYEHTLRAIEINDNCWAAHKWTAILLDYVWRYKSTKGRIQNSFKVKKHLEKAVELNPSDSTTYYLLGEWCYTFADLPWYQRQAASVIFASPPTSTFEEAYSYFEKAELISPDFYSMNLLMLGKCLIKMKKSDDAIPFLLKAYNYPVKTPDDTQAHEESLKLLRELGIYI